MKAARIYYDYNATAPVRPAVVEAVTQALSSVGNPSSVHAEGRSAHAQVEAARRHLAAFAGARPENTIFTSGGSEANNASLTSGLRRKGDDRTSTRLFVGAGEHASVLKGHGFPSHDVEHIPLTSQGVVDLAWFQRRLSAPDLFDGNVRVVVSVQRANNETGVLQPVCEIARLAHAIEGIMHCDGVQALGKIPLKMQELGADVVTLSAHKLGGPQGVGAILLGGSQILLGDSLIRGGGQEAGRRAGTHNCPGIIGFGVAARVAEPTLIEEEARLTDLRNKIEVGVRMIAPDANIFSEQTARLPNTSAFAIPAISAQTLLMALDIEGIALSSGSACSSGAVRPSHVLQAMGIEPSLIAGAIRISLGWNSRENEVDRFLTAFETVYKRLYRL